MLIIALKISLCSGIIWGFYQLFLAKESTFTFNRYFLLIGILFSYCIPFIKINLPEKEVEKQPIVFQQEVTQTFQAQPNIIKDSFSFDTILIAAYFLIVIALIFKFLYSLKKINNLKGQPIIYKNTKVKILEKNHSPFSFLNTIYISKNYFESGKINEQIFLHEKLHIQQKHSLDLIFIELLMAISWFNPFIYLFKKAIANNHEFMVDREVLSETKNMKNYQELIFEELIKTQNLSLTHRFNYNNTKKRLIMMTNKNSKFAFAKKLLVIPILGSLALFFAEKVYGNNTIEIIKQKSDLVQSKGNSVGNSTDAFNEFIEITNKYNDIIKSKDFERFKSEVPREEQEKLIELQNNVNFKEWDRLPIWIKYHEILKAIPSQKQINQFQNKIYNVKIDGQNVDNNILKNYKNTDFYSVSILKVFPKNPDYGKYKFGVTLYTKEYSKKYNSEKNISLSFSLSSDEYKNSIKKDTISPQKTIEAKLVKVNDQKVENETKSVKTFGVDKPMDDKNLVNPQFPGGVNQFRTEISKNFDGSVFPATENGLHKAEINFTIEKDGSVHSVQATGDNKIFNKEAERVVQLVTGNTKWKPATKDGEPVSYRFRLPLTMSFENFKK